MQQVVVNAPLLNTGCTLGEAPLYDVRTSTLHFVDIEEMRVYHLHTESLDLKYDQYDVRITSLALRRDGSGLACTTAKGFAVLEDGGAVRYLSQPIPDAELPDTRFNDGACDAKGRFFAGTVCSRTSDVPGRLYMFDPANGRCQVVDPGPFTDSNGLGWSPDGKTMYFTDSLVNHIHAYDYDEDSGQLSNRSIFIDPLAQGQPDLSYPDGLCLDSEGGIWSARWGASRVIRYTPAGTPDFEIVLPSVLRPTACCFGGPHEDRLYVTTAHCGAVGGDPARQEEFPDSGHLFVVDLSGRFRGGVWRHPFGG